MTPEQEAKVAELLKRCQHLRARIAALRLGAAMKGLRERIPPRGAHD